MRLYAGDRPLFTFETNVAFSRFQCFSVGRSPTSTFRSPAPAFFLFLLIGCLFLDVSYCLSAKSFARSVNAWSLCLTLQCACTEKHWCDGLENVREVITSFYGAKSTVEKYQTNSSKVITEGSVAVMERYGAQNGLEASASLSRT